MAQSQSELKENKNSRGRNKSTSNQMEMSKLELLDLDPIEILDNKDFHIKKFIDNYPTRSHLIFSKFIK